MFQLRVYGDPATMSAVADALDALAGVRHVSLVEPRRRSGVNVTADIRADAADAALSVVGKLGVPASDVVFTRLDTIGEGANTTELVALV